jgi:hypothetical protein
VSRVIAIVRGPAIPERTWRVRPAKARWSRRVHAFSDVSDREAPPERLFQGTVDDDVRVLDRARRVPLVKLRPVEPLQASGGQLRQPYVAELWFDVLFDEHAVAFENVGRDAALDGVVQPVVEVLADPQLLVVGNDAFGAVAERDGQSVRDLFAVFPIDVAALLLAAGKFDPVPCGVAPILALRDAASPFPRLPVLASL